jgi:NAD(P)-dependent dehydrogenase (short-subunit alcohol dehydrogenase family)
MMVAAAARGSVGGAPHRPRCAAVTHCRLTFRWRAQVDAAVKLALKKFGKLDITVNCAGIFEGELMLAAGKPHSLALFNKARRRHVCP